MRTCTGPTDPDVQALMTIAASHTVRSARFTNDNPSRATAIH